MSPGRPPGNAGWERNLATLEIEPFELLTSRFPSRKLQRLRSPNAALLIWLPTSVSGELIDSQDELNKNRNQILKPELRAGCAPLKNSLVQPLEAMCFLRAGNVSKLLMAGRPWMNTEITLLKSVELFQFVPLKIWSLKFKTVF